ncbi:MAG: hypothetical protein WA510_06680, partial [Acidobacteriaceae bacterium]
LFTRGPSTQLLLIPSFAYFAKGGMPLLFTRGPSTQLLLIPPFAESAKDGAPDPWSLVTEFSRRLFQPLRECRLANPQH